jgi:hypothetical protein
LHTQREPASMDSYPLLNAAAFWLWTDYPIGLSGIPDLPPTRSRNAAANFEPFVLNFSNGTGPLRALAVACESQV